MRSLHRALRPVFGLVVLSLAAPLFGQLVYTVNRFNAVTYFLVGYSANVTGGLTALPVNEITIGAPPPYSLVADPLGRFLYLVSTGSDDILGYSINAATGALTLIPGSPFTQPAFVFGSAAVDPTGKFLYSFGVAHGEFTIAGFTIDSSSGALAPIPGSQFSLGGNSGGLAAIAADPQGRFLYVVTSCSCLPAMPGDISAFTINPSTGALTLVPGSPFAAGQYPTSIAADPTGRFLYLTDNPGPPQGGVLAYRVNASTGALTAIAGSPFAAGAIPSGITVDPSGRFVYLANDVFEGPITGYSINADTGALTPIPGSPFANVGYGAFQFAVLVDPTDQYAYVAAGTPSGPGFNEINLYGIDTETGALSPLPSLSCCDAPLAIAPIGIVPLAVSVFPNSGSGAKQTFTFEYGDAKGYASLNIVYAGVAAGPFTEHACRVEYRHAANRLYLQTDDGSAFLGPVTPGVAGTVSNSQGTLDAGASSVSGSGDILALNLAISFKPSFAGMQSLFMYAIDKSGVSTPGRQNVGTWTVP